INNNQIPVVESIKYLGMLFEYNLKWNAHIENSINKAAKSVAMVQYNLHLKLRFNAMKYIYCAFIRPILTYGSTLITSASPSLLEKIYTAERILFKRLTKIPISTRSSVLYLVANFSSTRSRIGDLSIRSLIQLKNSANKSHPIHSLNTDRSN